MKHLPTQTRTKQTNTKKYKEFAANYQWVPGLIDKKGLGIFAKLEITLEPLNWDNGDRNFFLPVRVNDTFNIVACWPKDPYINEVLPYLELNAGHLDAKTIIVGDFNSNPELIIHGKETKTPHMKLVSLLREKGLVSAYHLMTGEEPGKETTPTFFLYRNIANPFFIDYCFLNPAWFRHMDIGSYAAWSRKGNTNGSDHLPLIVDIEISE